MASIRKRANGTYQATISNGYDSDGEQIRQYITRDTLRECKSAAYELELENEERAHSNKGSVRFLTWADEWYKMTVPTIEESTAKTYRCYIDKHYIPKFGNMKLGSITDIHIKQWLGEQIEKGLSMTSVRKHYFILSKLLFDALKYKSPCVGIKAPKQEEYAPTIVTADMFKTLIDGAKNQTEELIMLLTGWCGMRPGEIFALKWNDLDWDNGTIRIDEAMGITGKAGFKEKKTKSDRGMRTIVAPDELMEALKGYQKTAIDNDGHRIFPMRPDSWSSRFSKLAANCGLPEVRFYDLRHYHATWMYDNGISDHEAAKRLGHDVLVLKTIYQHITAQREMQSTEKIRNIR